MADTNIYGGSIYGANLLIIIIPRFGAIQIILILFQTFQDEEMFLKAQNFFQHFFFNVACVVYAPFLWKNNKNNFLYFFFVCGSLHAWQITNICLVCIFSQAGGSFSFGAQQNPKKKKLVSVSLCHLLMPFFRCLSKKEIKIRSAKIILCWVTHQPPLVY